MKPSTYQWVLILALCIHCRGVIAVDVLVGENAYSGYQTFLAGRNVFAIHDYSGIDARREVIEIVLLQHALHMGGYSELLTFKPVRLHYRRRLQLVAAGQYALWVNTAWRQDALHLTEDVHVSAPVIKRGEYLVGLYTHPSNSNALAARTLEDVQKLSAVSSKGWSADWNTLASLQLNNVNNNNDWFSFGRVITSGRADFMLAPFQAGADQTLYHKRLDTDLNVIDVVKLVPIPKVQIYLDDSRHWLVSQKYNDGRKIFQALQRGLALLESTGERRAALIESGFIAAGSDRRMTLNPEQVAEIPSVRPSPDKPSARSMP